MTLPVSIKLFIGGFILQGIIQICIVIFMNLASQHVQDRLEELKNILEVCDFENRIIDGEFQNVTKEQNLIIKHFEEFKGFDGYGYFHLSKSLLTGVVSNFVTYLIVLIQFKVSEISV